MLRCWQAEVSAIVKADLVQVSGMSQHSMFRRKNVLDKEQKIKLERCVPVGVMATVTVNSVRHPRLDANAALYCIS